MSLTATGVISLVARHTKVADLATPVQEVNLTKRFGFANGVGADQADLLWHDERTLNASASEDLDLTGVLTDVYGAAVNLARVRGIYVFAESTNVNNVVIGAALSNAWAGMLNAAGTIQVVPGSGFIGFARNAAGWPVVAGTGDLLKIANGGGGSAVTYEIAVLGASA